MQPVIYLFFELLVGCRPTLGYSEGDSFNNLILIDRLFVLLTFQIICQGKSQHKNWWWDNLWNLSIAIKLKDKYFHNFMDWSELFFKFISLHNWWKFSDLQSSDYRKMYFYEPSPRPPPPCHDLIYSPLSITSPTNFP